MESIVRLRGMLTEGKVKKPRRNKFREGELIKREE